MPPAPADAAAASPDPEPSSATAEVEVAETARLVDLDGPNSKEHTDHLFWEADLDEDGRWSASAECNVDCLSRLYFIPLFVIHTQKLSDVPHIARRRILGGEARDFFTRTGLPFGELSKVWRGPAARGRRPGVPPRLLPGDGNVFIHLMTGVGLARGCRARCWHLCGSMFVRLACCVIHIRQDLSSCLSRLPSRCSSDHEGLLNSQAGHALDDQAVLRAALDRARWMQHSGAPLPKLRVERREGLPPAQPLQLPQAYLERVSAGSEFSAGSPSTASGMHSRSSSFGTPAAGQSSPVRLPSVSQAARHENGGAAGSFTSPVQARHKHSNSAQDPARQLPPRSRSQLGTGKTPAVAVPAHGGEPEAANQAAGAANRDRLLHDIGMRSPAVAVQSMGPLASAAVKLHGSGDMLRSQSDAGLRLPGLVLIGPFRLSVLRVFGMPNC